MCFNTGYMAKPVPHEEHHVLGCNSFDNTYIVFYMALNIFSKLFKEINLVSKYQELSKTEVQIKKRYSLNNKS